MPEPVLLADAVRPIVHRLERERARRAEFQRVSEQIANLAATMYRPAIRTIDDGRIEVVDLGPPVLHPGISLEPGALNSVVDGRPCHVGVDRAAPGSDAAYVVEWGSGVVRAYRIDTGRKVEPLEAVMDLDDGAAERRQMEAREAAVGRLWAADRWGR